MPLQRAEPDEGNGEHEQERFPDSIKARHDDMSSEVVGGRMESRKPS